ncbi:hypothetical protein [Pseudomonas baetica]|uniref:hypothetical protein n=1 Tax=Pseudomonas baetica TaxID=674054 RepID=UPI0024063D2F|nr:hypothetical protein [Pseudomonas baetica]MDF9775571.1 hypothetical protein [Pseudomonas baetica]
MNDLSQGEPLTGTATEVERDEFLKIVSIGDTIKHQDNSITTVVRKTYVHQMSGNYKIEVASERK